MKEIIDIKANFAYEKGSNFNKIVRPACFSFQENLNFFWKERFKKIIITFYEEGTKDYRFFGDEQFICFDEHINYNEFWEKNLQEKREYILSRVLVILKNLNKKFDWNIEDNFFDTAFQKTINSNFDWSGYINIKSTSPSGEHTVKFFYKYIIDIHKFQVSCKIYDKSNDLKSEFILVYTMPFYMSLSEIIKKINWLNNDEFVILPKGGDLDGFKLLVNIKNIQINVDGKLPEWFEIPFDTKVPI